MNSGIIRIYFVEFVFLYISKVSFYNVSWKFILEIFQAY